MSSHQVLAELKKSNFTLLNESIQFDENGDPKFGSYTIVVWKHSGDTEQIGFFKFNPSMHSFINDTKIQWYTGGEVSHISLMINNTINMLVLLFCVQYYPLKKY